jgi:hypothetical protein
MSADPKTNKNPTTDRPNISINIWQNGTFEVPILCACMVGRCLCRMAKPTKTQPLSESNQEAMALFFCGSEQTNNNYLVKCSINLLSDIGCKGLQILVVDRYVNASVWQSYSQ